MKRLVLGITSPGSGPLIKGQASYFKSLGYEVFLMAPAGEKIQKYCEDEGCHHVQIDIVRTISLWKDLKAFAQIVRKLHAIKPDIVNVGTPKMGLLGILAAAFLGVSKRIYTCRGFRYEHEKGFQRKLLRLMEKLSAAFAHRVVCISRSVRDFGIADDVFNAQKTVLIGHGSSNGVDLAFFNPANVEECELAALKENLGLNGKFVFGFVGRLLDRKGISELYNAFIKVNQEFPDTALLLVGGITEQQFSDKNLVRKFEDHPDIQWVGFQHNVPLYMSAFDIFVLPAWWEGFGNVLIQAAAMGVPVVSTSATGCRDAVCDGYNGILVSPKDEAQLISAMKTYLSDARLKDEHGKNGIAWAKNFPSEVIWNGLHNLYLS